MPILTPDEIEALLLSLKISSVAVAAALPFAVATALILSRRFRGKSLLDGIVQLPLVLPPVAMGFLLLMIFGTRSGVGAFLKDQFGIVLVFRWTGAVLASAIFTFPFQVRAIRLALEARDKGLDEAARTLGAGWFDRLINITLPLALPGLVAGAITAFAASLGEFGAIITFVSNIPGETRTLPLAIYTALQTPGRRGGSGAAFGALHRAGLPVSPDRAGHHAARHGRIGRMSADVRIQHVQGNFTLDVAFTAASGGVTALFGPSGAGKTSIVHALAGLTRPEHGRIVLEGRTVLDTEADIFVPPEKRRIGLVFQDARLFPAYECGEEPSVRLAPQ